MAGMIDEDALGPPLARHLGPGTVAVDVRRLTGGASRETWAFDAVAPDGERRALVVRRDPGASSPVAMGRTTEYRVLEAAAASGVPVPRVCFPLEPGDGLGSGFVMERIEGETIPRRILRDERYERARAAMASQCGTIAAQIHSVERAALPDLPVQGAADQVRQYRELLDAFGEPHPTFELGLRWLDERAPASREPASRELDQERTPVLVHGDFRNGNFVVGSDGVRAVLDWELAHLGDPMEDLGWLCVKAWRFREVGKPVGGFGERAELFEAYEAASGQAVDPEAVHYWEVFGTLKWGVMCVVQAFTHLSGAHRSVDLAAVGRRVAEQERDLLAMIDPRRRD